MSNFLSKIFNTIFPNSGDSEKTRLFKQTIFAFLGMALILIFTSLAVFFLVIKGEDDTTVPNVVGMEITVGIKSIQDSRLVPYVEIVNNPGLEDFEILEQEPKEEANVKEGSRVTIFVNRDSGKVNIANYIGQSVSLVESSIENLNITLEDYTYVNSTEPWGTVIDQYPPSGYPIAGGDDKTLLSLTVSLGPRSTARVPALIDRDYQQAIQELISLEIPFNVAIRDVAPATDERPGTVVSQSIDNGQSLPVGTFLDLVVTRPQNLESNEVFGVYEFDFGPLSDNVEYRLEVVPAEGANYNLYLWKQPGGKVAMPYRLNSGDTLVLYVAGEDYEWDRQQLFSTAPAGN
jgi:beta-lactam-binding protein with PASTA domain